MPQVFRYPWPCSAIDGDLMRRLYLARESSPTPTTIVQLIRDAVYAAYGQAQTYSETQPSKENNETDHPPFRVVRCAGRPIQGRQRSRSCSDLDLPAA